ncbi:MAG: metallophosphoesterase family protein [Phycisphaerae bacterium]|nr:metallophosphoesterase family protein [Phycisphaerae bacterium]NNF43781.1 hypothetical protein [Phycisphaerales bacterium]
MSATLILSDLHLGRPHGSAGHADALRPLWAGVDRLIINGDTAEVHHPRHRRAAADETLRLCELCEQDGVELTLLSGNHDPFLSDLRHLQLAGGAVFVTHGDVLHPAIAPWSPAAGRIRLRREAALASMGAEPRDRLAALLEVSQHAAFAEWADLERLESEAAGSSVLGMLLRPWALVATLRYWREFPDIADRFLTEHAPETRFALFGHTHHDGIWERNGRTIINTGSYGFPGRPLAVRLTDEMILVERVRRRHGHFGRGDAIWSHPLPAPVAENAPAPATLSPHACEAAASGPASRP